MNGITAIVLTKNEEKNILHCLESLNFCDEILVIDDFSTDATLSIAKEKNAKIVQKKSKNNFSNQRNFAIDQAKNDWIIFVDADERVTPELKKEIQDIDDNTEYVSYSIPRRDFWWGKELKYGEVRKARNTGIIRFIKKGSGIWEGNVHEVYKTTEKTGKLRSFLDHYPHQTVKEFIQEINFYSTIRARELQEKGKQSSLAAIIGYPFFKFLLVYFVYLGFLDGPAGFAYAFLMSFHSFLVRIKLYQFQNLS